MLKKYIILFFSLILLVFCGGGTAPDSGGIVEIRGMTMGTSYMVKIVVDGADEAVLTVEIDDLLKKVNLQMSTWIADSELSRFNDFDGAGWFDVSADTALVVAESLRISEMSHGAFDMTVGPLINLWGFGPGKREVPVPSDAQIAAVMASTGYGNVSVQSDPPALKKAKPGIYCSLAAIAKGFGVDKVAEYLDAKGFTAYLVEIGGELRTRGVKAEGKPWKVAIATPDGRAGHQKVLALNNVGMATSGDYYNYFEKDGKRYSHTIDPVTGRPITHTLASVTVIHESCMTADALATAINVMGPEKGYQLALENELSVFLIVKEKGVFVEKMTPRFEQVASGR